ncbi:uncharacterized protein [Palaemon carinicauda]|uniref:uncharacterized protein n=1 Tax=Palaemon carinicauda TaxID=392227 RepID=UPI0035B5D859
MSEQLEKVEGKKVASIHQLESVFEEETEELKETLEEQLGIIREMKTEKERLEMSLTEARINDLVRNGRYNCLLEELKGLKEEYLIKSREMEGKNHEMSEQLERAKDEKVASIHRLESVFEEETGELKETVEEQLGIIREMKTEKGRLEMSLTEAKTKNLTNEGNYTCLVNELKDTKKEACRAKDELSRASGEIGELKKSMASMAKERDSLKERVCHLRSGEEMAEDRIVQTTKEKVGLKDELLAANEIISSLGVLQDELEEEIDLPAERMFQEELEDGEFLPAQGVSQEELEDGEFLPSEETFQDELEDEIDLPAGKEVHAELEDEIDLPVEEQEKEVGEHLMLASGGVCNGGGSGVEFTGFDQLHKTN